MHACRSIQRLQRAFPSELRDIRIARQVVQSLAAVLDKAGTGDRSTTLSVLSAIGQLMDAHSILRAAQQAETAFQLRFCELIDRCSSDLALLGDRASVMGLLLVQRRTGNLSKVFWQKAASTSEITWDGVSLPTAMNMLSKLAKHRPVRSTLRGIPHLESRLLGAMQEQVGSLDAQGVANVLNGLARLRERAHWEVPASNCVALLLRAASVAGNMSAQGVANTWNALGKLGVHPREQLLSELQLASERVLPESNAQEVAITWNALGKLSVHPREELLSELQRASERVLPESSAQAVANTWNALGKLGVHPPEELLSELQRASERVLSESNAQNVANMWNALGKLGVLPSHLSTVLLAAARETASAMNDEDVATGMHALAALSVFDTDGAHDALLVRAAELVRTAPHTLSMQFHGLCLWALAVRQSVGGQRDSAGGVGGRRAGGQSGTAQADVARSLQPCRPVTPGFPVPLSRSVVADPVVAIGQLSSAEADTDLSLQLLRLLAAQLSQDGGQGGPVKTENLCQVCSFAPLFAFDVCMLRGRALKLRLHSVDVYRSPSNCWRNTPKQ